MKINEHVKIDPYLLGSGLGFILTIPYLTLDYLFSLLFKTNPIPIYSATLVVSHTNFFWDYIFSITADLTAGAFLGFIIAYILERTNYHHLWLKGLGTGSVLWIAHVSVIPKLWEPALLELMNRQTVYVAFFTHVLWGVVYAVFLNNIRRCLKEKNDIDNKCS